MCKLPKAVLFSVILFAFQPMSARGQSTPATYSFDWITWFNSSSVDFPAHWYGLARNYMTSPRAADLAAQWGAQLASFDTVDEFQFATNLIQQFSGAASYHTGLSAAPRQFFQWDDGTMPTFSFPQFPDGINTTSQTLRMGINATGEDFYMEDGGALSFAMFESADDPATFKPGILQAPVGGDFPNTAPATFNVSAIGPAPLAYQWKVDGVAIAGETYSTFSMPLTTSSTGMVSVVVANANGAQESAPVPVNIIPSFNTGTNFYWRKWSADQGGNNHWYGFRRDAVKPLDYAQAIDLAARLSATVLSLDDDAEANRVVTFFESEQFDTWIVSDLDADGNATTLNYRGDISLRPATTTSTTAIFESDHAPDSVAPIILNTNAPFRMSIGATNTIQFEIVAAGNVSYQWRFNGAALNSQTAPTLKIVGTSTNQTGAYDLVVQNSSGSVTSAPVQVTVFAPAPLTFTASRFPNDYLRIDLLIPQDIQQMYLEYTSDFKTWTAMPMPQTHGPMQDYEKMDTNAPRRFYRLHRTP